MYQFHSSYHNHITLLSLYLVHFFLVVCLDLLLLMLILLTDGRLFKIQSVTKRDIHDDDDEKATYCFARNLCIFLEHFYPKCKGTFGAFLEEKVSNVHSTKH